MPMKKELTSPYLIKRPHREKKKANPALKALIELMDSGFERGFGSYWEQFGFEIGGPVAYGYTKWLADELEKGDSEISDIAFVARDGWLLKKIYELLPHTRTINTHYVYAPRILSQQCNEKKACDEYREYLKKLGMAGGKTAVVDTVTVGFSSQRLLEKTVPNGTHGFFWAATKASEASRGLTYSVFQKSGISVVKCWDLIEFILSSPEPPVLKLDEGKPIYKEAVGFEKERERLFPEIESGVMQFVEEARKTEKIPVLDCAFITDWVNEFLKNPSIEDLEAFESVTFSARADHSDCIKMDPFSKKGVTAHGLKNKLWLFSTGHPMIYKAFHNGNALRRRIVAFFRGEAKEQFRGGDPEKLAEKLAIYDVISFDVFDTLILRSFEKPSDLFSVLENENGIAGFRDLRIKAESDARRNTSKPNREIDLSDIYKEVVESCDLDPSEAMDAEIEAEKKFCYANPEMITVCQVLHNKGRRLIAVSDMYLPEDIVWELLKKCGYDMFSAVYVSCNRGAGKGNGELLRLAKALEGRPVRCVHIGDSLSADVQGGRKAGWDTVWYRK